MKQDQPQPETTISLRNLYPNPVETDPHIDEIDRIARETARDAYRCAVTLLVAGKPAWRRFGVQHVGGRVTLTVELDRV